MTMAVRRGRGFFQMSLTLTLRGVAAFITPPHGAHPMLRRSSALHWTAPQSRISPSVKQSLGLVLLLGSTATGYALQLRRPKDERGVLCASASVSDTQVVLHRVGSTNHLPGGLVTTEHFFSVPLKHEDPSSPRIEVFVRELGLLKNKNKGANLPGLVFLQGGPGFQAGRPMSAESGWVKRALESHRVFLLDQRGTGRSTAVTFESLAALGDGEKQADYVSCMRADSIVKDCELVRKTLLGNETKWTVLGQSFGGFCVMTYLSLAPEGLQQALLTGGLPPVYQGCSADEVYGYTYKRAAERSLRFYQRYPQHVKTVRDIMELLEANPQPLPDGGILTTRRFQQLGLALGSATGIENLHYLLENPWQAELRDQQPQPAATRSTPAATAATRKLSFEFLKSVEAQSSFESSVMYAIGHEAIYCNGKGEASAWSAQRIKASFPEFDVAAALKRINPSFPELNIAAALKEGPDSKILLTGEHVHDWMFDGDYKHLMPLKACAEKLAAKADWPVLYDVERIKRSTVATAAVIYYDDMYVERILSEQTAALIGSSGGTPIKVWVTNEYQHSGIRDDGYKILHTLLAMLDGTVQIPS